MPPPRSRFGCRQGKGQDVARPIEVKDQLPSPQMRSGPREMSRSVHLLALRSRSGLHLGQSPITNTNTETKGRAVGKGKSPANLIKVNTPIAGKVEMVEPAPARPVQQVGSRSSPGYHQERGPAAIVTKVRVRLLPSSMRSRPSHCQGHSLGAAVIIKVKVRDVVKVELLLIVTVKPPRCPQQGQVARGCQSQVSRAYGSTDGRVQ